MGINVEDRGLWIGKGQAWFLIEVGMAGLMIAPVICRENPLKLQHGPSLPIRGVEDWLAGGALPAPWATWLEPLLPEDREELSQVAEEVRQLIRRDNAAQLG